MRKTFSSHIGSRAAVLAGVVALGVLLGANAPARADELLMPPPGETTPHPLVLPQRGQSQATVLHDFGEPRQRHAPVGGSSPKRPPITRWDYDGWSVFFERTTVVDVVVENDPPPISHVDELTPAP